MLRFVNRMIVEISRHCQQVLTVYNAKSEKNFKGELEMSAYDLAERVKGRLNLTSDYQLSELLGVSRSHVSNWKIGRNNPDGITMLKLAELSGLSASDALALVNQKSEQQQLNLQAGFSNVVFLSSLSAASVGAMSIAKLSALPYEAIGAMMFGVNFVYYVKSNEYNLSEIKGQLRTLSHHELLKFAAANDIEPRQVSASCIH